VSSAVAVISPHNVYEDIEKGLQIV
jgi:hypothetical protein